MEKIRPEIPSVASLYLPSINCRYITLTVENGRWLNGRAHVVFRRKNGTHVLFLGEVFWLKTSKMSISRYTVVI